MSSKPRKHIKPVIRQVFLAARNRGLARREEEVTNDRTERANRRFRSRFLHFGFNAPIYPQIKQNVFLLIWVFFPVLHRQIDSLIWISFFRSRVPRFPGSQVLVSFFYLSCLHVKLFTCILQAKKTDVGASVSQVYFKCFLVLLPVSVHAWYTSVSACSWFVYLRNLT